MSIPKPPLLTSEAERVLEKAVNEYRSRLVESAQEGSFIPGEDVVEITASDILRAVRGRPSGPMIERLARSNAFLRLAGFAYTVLGILLSTGALLWEPIVALIRSREVSAQLLVVGIAMMGFGVLVLVFARYRQFQIRQSDSNADDVKQM